MPLLRLTAVLPLTLALLAGCQTPPPSEAPATGSMQLTVHVPEGLPADVSSVMVTLSGSDLEPRSLELSPTEGAWGGELGDLPVGEHRSLRVQASDAAHTLLSEGRAEDVTVSPGSRGLVALVLRDPSARPPPISQGPIIDSLSASTTTALPGGNVSLTVSAHDTSGGPLSYSWDAASGRFSTPSLASTTWTASLFQAPVQLALTVSSASGAAITVSLTVNVTAGRGAEQVKVGFNLAPRLVGLTSSRSSLDVGQQTALSVSATSPDGDSLSYQWSATCEGTFTGATSSSATFTPSARPTAACNNCQVRVMVKNSRGSQNTGSLALCVAPPTARVPPILTRSFQSSPTARAGQQLTFEVDASDPSGSALAFAWTANVGTLGTASTGATSSRMVWTAPPCVPSGLTPGITATVTNTAGMATAKTFTLSGLSTCVSTSWTPGSSLVTSRTSGHTATRLPGGKLLVSGGRTPVTDVFLATAELYDPATGTWSATGAMSSPRAGHTETLLPSGKVLVVGGARGPGNENILATAEVYDPTTATWSPTGAMSSSRADHKATLLPGGKVLVSGGHGSSAGSRVTAEVYDPATGTWSATGSMSAPRSGHTSTLLPSGKVLVSGGNNNTAFSERSAELYDPTTGSWSLTGALVVPRENHTATLLPGGKLLVSAGYASGPIERSAELYDPVSGTWSLTGSLSDARSYHTATSLPDGRVLVVGGLIKGGGLLSSAELYDPATGLWSAAGAMSRARDLQTATLLTTGQVLVVAGYHLEGDPDPTELYTP